MYWDLLFNLFINNKVKCCNKIKDKNKFKLWTFICGTLLFLNGIGLKLIPVC